MRVRATIFQTFVAQFIVWNFVIISGSSDDESTLERFADWVQHNQQLNSQDTHRINSNWLNNDWKGYDYKRLRDFYHSMVAETLETSCAVFKRVAGRFSSDCGFLDGEKLLCMDGFYDAVKNRTCLVYSFGLSDDWDFELAMAEMGCIVRAYDPYINQPAKYIHSNIHYDNVGIGPANGYMDYYEDIYVKTFSSILKQNGDTDKPITYLKMDVEGRELEALEQMLKSGSLKNVQQFGLEIHLFKAKNKSTYKRFTKILHQLRSNLGLDLVAYNANNCAAKLLDPTRTYYSLHDLLFFKPFVPQ